MPLVTLPLRAQLELAKILTAFLPRSSTKSSFGPPLSGRTRCRTIWRSRRIRPAFAIPERERFGVVLRPPDPPLEHATNDATEAAAASVTKLLRMEQPSRVNRDIPPHKPRDGVLV